MCVVYITCRSTGSRLRCCTTLFYRSSLYGCLSLLLFLLSLAVNLFNCLWIVLLSARNPVVLHTITVVNYWHSNCITVTTLTCTVKCINASLEHLVQGLVVSKCDYTTLRKSIVSRSRKRIRDEVFRSSTNDINWLKYLSILDWSYKHTDT